MKTETMLLTERLEAARNRQIELKQSLAKVQRELAEQEANVERYTLMVRDFMATTQFLIVTHNKRTMAVADTLYGVTMEGNGISRPIAMRFEKEKAREHAAGA